MPRMAERFGFNFVNLGDDPRFAQWRGRVSGPASWPWKLGLLAAVIVVIVPIIVLVLSAVLAFTLVYVITSLIYRVFQLLGLTGERAVTSPLPDAPMRENVRVIDRE